MDKRRVTIRTVPQPSDLNKNGNIFGGWVLSQMDVAGGAVAGRRARGPVATVAVEGMKFHRPIEVGDVVSVYADVREVGRTSITVDIEVFAERGAAGEEHKVTEAVYIFVALDENLQPRALENDKV
ncbi:acyl-CoA thioesterase [Kordiimonas aquimaris]|uniref:acyl-CoA thioesterase n=1 Tax=Kordiimonas aquimaris TaxID=707591 RepID=UPI0021D2E05B|nr:acyl-CoA thioesterase [Kordiimonas aquimaris]